MSELSPYANFGFSAERLALDRLGFAEVESLLFERPWQEKFASRLSITVDQFQIQLAFHRLVIQKMLGDGVKEISGRLVFIEVVSASDTRSERASLGVSKLDSTKGFMGEFFSLNLPFLRWIGVARWSDIVSLVTDKAPNAGRDEDFHWISRSDMRTINCEEWNYG